MGRPKTPERRKPANAELRSAMGALELWIRHAAVKNSGVIKVTHHELVTIHDTLILALREDNPQSLLVLDTDGGIEVPKAIIEEAAKGTPVDEAKPDAASEIEETIMAELEPQLDADVTIDPDADLELEADASADTSDEDSNKT